MYLIFFFKQKTAYEMRISDWSSDVCSSDLKRLEHLKKLCSTLTDPARAALIFNIVEIPADLLPAKVAEHFFQVRHFCRAMMAECVPPKLGNIDPQMLRTPILSVKAADFTKAVAREAEDRKSTRLNSSH